MSHNDSSGRLDHLPVEPVGNSVSDMRGSVENTLSRERAGFLRKEKRRQCDTGDNCDRSFHLLSLLFNKLDTIHAGSIRVVSNKSASPDSSPVPSPRTKRRGKSSGIPGD